MTDDPRSFDDGATVIGSLEDELTVDTGGKSRSSRGGGGGTNFSEGDLVAGRYRVIRFLARGGMGEVYEVDDEELGDRVALKTILPEIAEDQRALERFRREILLARRVTHPNVSRIFDIGKHETDEGEISFLTMELLEGETLRQRMERGRFKSDEALPIVEQMVAGLDAAHSAGIVHRDFKPANVFLVPEGDRQRVVITDFGLARPGGSVDHDVTGTGEVVGTPAYMAPEQLEGGELSSATDIYALGLVMYEMLTGIRAFDGGTAFQIAVKRLQEDPASPSVHLPDINPRWEACIMRCLERRPEDRFRRVRDIVGVLRGETRLKTRRSRADFRSLFFLLLAVLVLFASLWGYRTYVRKSPAHTPVPTVSGRPAIAVLGFKNVSGDSSKQWISTAIAEVLTTELAETGDLRTIPGETVSSCLRDLGMEDVKNISPESLEVLHSNLGADMAVLGSFTTVPGSDSIRLDVRVQDVHSGDFLVTESETGTVGDFLKLAENAAQSLKEKLNLSQAGGGQTSPALPDDPEAARAYSRGVELMRRFHYPEALEELQKARRLQPDSAAIAFNLSAVLENLGFKARALKAARASLALSEKLDKEKRLRASALVARLSDRPEEAAEAYGSLWTFYPDNPEYGLAFAEAQIAGGKPRKALETVSRLRQLPEPLSKDPRIGLVEARALEVLGEYEKEIEAATGAEKRARELGARQDLAGALGLKASALIRLGRMGQAEKENLEAEKIWKDVGNNEGLAGTIKQRAVIAYRQGRLGHSRDLFEKALKIYEKLGVRSSMADAYNGLGGVSLGLGDAAAAEEYFRKALELYTEIEDRRNQATVWANIAVLKQRGGDFSTAIDALQRARVILGEIGAKDQEAMVLRNIAATYYGRGQLDEARKTFEEVVAINRETGNKPELAGSLFSLADVLTESAEWAEASRRYSESETVAHEIQSTRQEVLARYGGLVAEVEKALLSGDVSGKLLTRLDGAISELKEAGATDYVVLANILASRVALARGNSGRSREYLERAGKGLEGVSDLGTQTAYQIQEARVAAAAGEVEKAVGQLSKLLEKIEKTGILGLEFQVRYALGRVEIATSSRRSRGKKRLEELRKEADSRGWRLLSARIDRAERQ